eukprot:TRINITY_DN74715_c0_g1_i1.p1 TRINITY_DN74715_c0_g1~~TRINITY_DN74715_c0_g1_i1.p1  ORF type:complete len:527 (-),score=46.39 TRINITY_DN74715_c0_g1_i1:271-1851(-)
MGIHSTKPSLFPVSLRKIQDKVQEHVLASPLVNKERLLSFSSEMSRWVHRGEAIEMMPWQRGTMPFLTRADLHAILLTDTKMCIAFSRPTLGYAACRGALVAWPEVWPHADQKLRLELASIDVRCIDSWLDALTTALSALAFALLYDDVCAWVVKRYQKKVQKACARISTPSPLDGARYFLAPSKRDQVKEVQEDADMKSGEACRAIRYMIRATTRSHAQSIYGVVAEEGRLLEALPRHAGPELIQTPKLTVRQPVITTRSFLDRCLGGSTQVETCGEIIVHQRRAKTYRADVVQDVCVRDVHLDGLLWHEVDPNVRSCRSFYRRSEFAEIVARIEAVIVELRAEFRELWCTQRGSFLPWQEDGTDVEGWTLFGMHLFGERLKQNCALAPVAASLASALNATSCGYSVLSPGTHIPPHAEDGTSSATRVHVPLQVPSSCGCGLRVADQAKVWIDGELLLFDATQDHEAWNLSDEERVVLLIDFGAEHLPPWQWPQWLKARLIRAGSMEAVQFERPDFEDVSEDNPP